MSIPKRYNPRTQEPELDAFWQEQGVYQFVLGDDAPVYTIDTPPATVSGKLHLGHTYSYSQTDFVARFWRMMGHNVFYPMGYDDNGLPTTRLVEKLEGISEAGVGHEAFIERCRAVGLKVGQEYEALWRRLGLSVDWRYTYRTIDAESTRIAQWSFIDLYRKGLVYRKKAPALWCTECHTTFSQSELDDLERPSTFYTLAFGLDGGQTLPIATTRPELLPACVAVFVHPDDPRFAGLHGLEATVPLWGQRVPILADRRADPDKGSGAVMCCTFGDVTDIEWWHVYNLPLIEAITPDGRMSEAAGPFAGQPLDEARRNIVRALEEQRILLARRSIEQSVRVHERCDTPVEYIVLPQWFVRVLDFKAQLIDAGEQIAWHPDHMRARYRQWVESLSWDWCISSQRAFGVPFPVWYCRACGAVIVADENELPVDPLRSQPAAPCSCGSRDFSPETDVLNTWATSSMSPQIAGRFGDDPALYGKVWPMALRPQAHDIIRTWAFCTIVKSLHHFDRLPWSDIAISGWGIAGEGMGKISKSRGGGPMSPQEMIDKYSADAVRYWAASTGLGKDAVISEDKIALGQKLVNKLWNVARFSEPFLHDDQPAGMPAMLSPADCWILARARRLIETTTRLMQQYDHAAAKSEVENFFWTELADNYLEMAKLRLYDEQDASRAGAQYALRHTLLTVLKLFAPFLPYISEAIYRHLFAGRTLEGAETASIHAACWPIADESFSENAPGNAEAETHGEILCQIATAVRRYKSEHSLSLGSELAGLHIAVPDRDLADMLCAARADLTSITRARIVQVAERAERAPDATLSEWNIEIAIDAAWSSH